MEEGEQRLLGFSLRSFLKCATSHQFFPQCSGFCSYNRCHSHRCFFSQLGCNYILRTAGQFPSGPWEREQWTQPCGFLLIGYSQAPSSPRQGSWGCGCIAHPNSCHCPRPRCTFSQGQAALAPSSKMGVMVIPPLLSHSHSHLLMAVLKKHYPSFLLGNFPMKLEFQHTGRFVSLYM